METIKKLLVIVIIVASTMLKSDMVYSQCFSNQSLPSRTEVQSAWPIMDFNEWPGSCSGSAGDSIQAVGINQQSPDHILDIYGHFTGDGVNVSGAGRNVGYSINGYRELFMYGLPENIFLGYLAGGNGGETGQFNTVCGFAAGDRLTVGQWNTLLGASAGHKLTGDLSGMSSFAYWNTMTGIDAGYYDSIGYSCNYYGKCAGFHCNGNKNCMFGSHSGDGDGGTGNMGVNTYNSDSNCFFGNWSGYNYTSGACNVMMGNGAGANTAAYGSGNTSAFNVFIGGYGAQKNPAGNYNITLGYQADAYGLSGTTPTTITNAVAIGADAYVNLDNEFIIGNNAQSSGIGMVGEGFPLGKLEVFQHSGSTNTIGEYVTNTDLSSGAMGFAKPLIGIESRILAPSSTTFYTVAGWFEADGKADGSVPQGYAIFVPKTLTTSITKFQPGGVVDIGFQFAADNPTWLLKVNGNIQVNGSVLPSDSSIKKNITPFKYGIKAIRNLNPYTYKYNGIGGFDSTNTYIGLVAQNLQRNVPNGVLSSLITKDTITGDTETIKDIYEEAVIYTAVNAIKEVDSAVTANHSGSFGACGTTLPALTSDEGIDMNDHNLLFAGNSSTTLNQNQVLIGYTCGAAAPAKLNVLQNSGASSSTGLYVENDDPGCTVIGVKSIVKTNLGGTAETKVAGWFEADTALNCCASANNEQYAIYVPGGGGTVALGYPAATFPCALGTHFQLEVKGSAFLSTGTVWSTSDSTIKTNVQAMSNPLATISKLNGVSFSYIPSAISDGGSKGTQYGFIAQQVARVLPSVVKTGPDGLEGVSYTEIIPWTVEAIKQEKQTNDSLRNTVDSLRAAFKSIQNCLTQLCNNGHGANRHNGGGSGNSGDSNATILNTQDVTLSALANAPLLYQNIPNPFNTATKINYYLPVGTQGASIVFYDTYGNKIKTVELSQTGNGTLNVTPDNLTSGIYSYSLVVNGNVVDTKRMILQK